MGWAEKLFQPPAELRRAGAAADDVVAYVGDARRPFLGGQQGVEGSHAVGLRRGHLQPAAEVVQRRRADPADLILHPVQRRQQQVPRAAPGAGAADLDAPAGRGALQVRAGRRRHRAVQHGVDRGALGGSRLRRGEAQVHQRAASLSMRTAVALNSAVPDLRSQASMVSRLVSTWSGKCRVMNTSPGRSPPV